MAVIQNIPFNLFGEEVGVGLQLRKRNDLILNYNQVHQYKKLINIISVLGIYIIDLESRRGRLLFYYTFFRLTYIIRPL